MKKIIIYFVLGLLLHSSPLLAQAPLPKGAAEGIPSNNLPADLLLRGWLQEPFMHGVVINKPSSIRNFEQIKKEENTRYADLIGKIRNTSNINKPLGIIFVDENSKIVFEEYNKGATSNSKVIAYSMSKSLTSLGVGKALCKGHLDSLDDLAEKYSPSLIGTSYGRATIRQLLTMSSGGMQPHFNGQPVEGVTSALLRYRSKTIRNGFVEYGSDNYKASAPGVFRYKNFDTYALGVVISDATKMPFYKFFAENIWSETGAQSDAAWLLDKNGDAATAEGFGATLRDWARVAIYIMHKMKSDDDICFRDYLKQATTAQIENNSNGNREFRGYGYQFWVNHWMAEKSVWMRGYAGQMLGMDPSSGRAIVVLSNEGGHPDAYTRLFDAFARID